MMEAADNTLGDGKRVLEDPAANDSPNKKTKTGDKKLNYWCEICKVGIKDEEDSISTHNLGTKHLKKVASQQLLIKLRQEYDCFEENHENGNLQCIICSLVSTSPQLLEAHLHGIKHKKMAASAAANGNADAAGGNPTAAGAGMASAATPSPGTEVVNGGYWCEICKLHGKTTPQLIAAHVAGSKHKKKQANSELLQRLKDQEDCFEQHPVSGKLKCLVCNLELASPHQLESHFAGDKHRRKAQSAAAAEGAAEIEEGEVPVEEYWCEVCKLSGPHTPISVSAHRMGSKHLKKVESSELLQKLKETTSCFDINEETGMLTCKVCNIEVNTPQLLDIHLKGNKHKMRLEGRPDKRRQNDEKRVAERKSTAPLKFSPAAEDAECTVFLRNIAFKSTEEDIQAAFADCGEIANLHLIKDFKGRSKGFGYLIFKEKDGAVNALEKNETVLEERKLFVSAYNPEERREHNRGKLKRDPTTMTEEQIRNLSAPHGKIKDVGGLMNKWALAYYRNKYGSSRPKMKDQEIRFTPDEESLCLKFPEETVTDDALKVFEMIKEEKGSLRFQRSLLKIEFETEEDAHKTLSLLKSTDDNGDTPKVELATEVLPKGLLDA